jgi:hypothetical protein
MHEIAGSVLAYVKQVQSITKNREEDQLVLCTK